MASSIVGVGLKLFGGLLAAHDARVQAAKTENQALNQLVPIVATNLQDLFAALNAGQVSEGEALSYLTQIEGAFWSNLQPVQQASTGCSNNGGNGNNEPSGAHTKCDKHCTAGCCVGCNNIRGWMANAAAVINAHGGTATFHAIPGCNACNGGKGYGFNPTADFTLTYKPIPVISGITNQINGTLQGAGNGQLPSAQNGLSDISPIVLVALGGLFVLLVAMEF